jgi:hypothetical protein
VVEFKLGPLGTLAIYWPIVPAPGVCEDGEFGGMKIGRGNRNTRRKPVPAPLCLPQIPFDQTRARTQAAAVRSQKLTAWAMARPVTPVNEILQYCCRSCSIPASTEKWQWASKIPFVTEMKFDTHYTVKKCWQHDKIVGIAMNESAGHWAAAVRAAWEMGFTERVEPIYDYKSKSEDYYHDMNS